MYRNRPNLQIGFHGCDEVVRDELVSKPDVVKKSQESYDWLGHGFYVWENNLQRALQWAEDKKARGTLENPSIVGVVYQLGYCLDFTDSEFISLSRDISKEGFSAFKHFDTVRGIFTEGGPAYDGAGIQSPINFLSE